MKTMTASASSHRQNPARDGVWHARHDGLVTVACQGGEVIATIAGPWSERHLLTWWMPHCDAGSIELHDSLEAAQAAVWARIGNEGNAPASDLQMVLSSLRASLRPSWLTRLRKLFAVRDRRR